MHVWTTIKLNNKEPNADVWTERNRAGAGEEAENEDLLACMINKSVRHK